MNNDIRRRGGYTLTVRSKSIDRCRSWVFEMPGDGRRRGGNGADEIVQVVFGIRRRSDGERAHRGSGYGVGLTANDQGTWENQWNTSSSTGPTQNATVAVYTPSTTDSPLDTGRVTLLPYLDNV